MWVMQRSDILLESSEADRGPVPAASIMPVWCCFSFSCWSLALLTRQQCVCACVYVCMPHQDVQNSELSGSVVMPFSSLVTHNAIVSKFLCAKWVVFCLIKYSRLQTDWNPRPGWHSCLINVFLSPLLTMFSFSFKYVSDFKDWKKIPLYELTLLLCLISDTSITSSTYLFSAWVLTR